MRILIVITRGDSIGGAQTHVLSLARLLKKNGHKILICYGGDIMGPFNKLLNESFLDYTTISNLKREISPINDFISIIKLNRIILQFKPDLLSLHSSKAGIIGRISGMFSCMPVVFTVHGWAFTEGVSRGKSLFYKALEKGLSRLATKLIVVSNYDRQIALDNNIANGSKIHVVHNGIKILEDDDPRQIIDHDIVNAVMVARFDEQKDHETLIHACIDLDKIKIHLLGDGPNFKAMVKLVGELKLQNKFVFYGYSQQVEKVLRESDIFLLISNWEGFPISTLEAMNYSLPVIVSDVGGAVEAINESGTGFSVSRKDVNDLKSKLSILINDSSLRKSMGINGRKKLIEYFSDEVMYENTVKVYLEAINMKKR